MKFINENAPAIGVLLVLVSMVVGVTVWVVTEINHVRDDLHHTEIRLTEKINQNAAGIAEINERLARIEARMDRSDQRFETMLEALINHSHTEDGSAVFTKPVTEEDSADTESPAAQK